MDEQKTSLGDAQHQELTMPIFGRKMSMKTLLSIESMVNGVKSQKSQRQSRSKGRMILTLKSGSHIAEFSSS